jgi:hypothetical protein
MTYEEYLALTEPSAAILVAMNAEIGAVIRAEIAERRYKRKLITIQKRNGKAILREFRKAVRKEIEPFKRKVRAAWRGMKRRCTSPNTRSWKSYGGRGIQFNFLCFDQFFAEVGIPPTLTHSIDRINGDGHYQPGNVRWATPEEQLLNRRPRKRTACSAKA